MKQETCGDERMSCRTEDAGWLVFPELNERRLAVHLNKRAVMLPHPARGKEGCRSNDMIFF